MFKLKPIFMGKMDYTDPRIINKALRADSATALRPSRLGHCLGWLHRQTTLLFPLAPLQYIWPIMCKYDVIHITESA